MIERTVTAPAITSDPLFDTARLPGLSPQARALLRWMREHPQAPRYRNHSGHRLNLAQRWQARARHVLIEHRLPPRWVPGAPLPAWVARFIDQCRRDVPAHARTPVPMQPGSLDDIPTMDRHALASALAAHMPRDLPLDELICFSTSGTTGHPLRVPSHPRVACDYYAHHRRALAHFGIAPRAGSGLHLGLVERISSGVRDQMSHGRPFRTRRLVPLDRALLDGHQHGVRGQQLRHGREREHALLIAQRAGHAVRGHHGHRHVLDRPRRRHFHAPHGTDVNVRV